MRNNEFIIENLEIKNYRRFKNISRVDEDFRRFNLIYGWNYSGKTTLSRIFANFDGQIKTDKTKIEGEYSLIKCENHEKLTQNDSDKLLIHTFNSDYIKNNIFFESNKLNNIIIIANKAEEIVNEIKKLEKEKEIINKDIKEYVKEEKGYTKEISELKKNCAKFILDATAQGRFTAANLPAIENKLDKTNLTQYILESDKINIFSKTIRSQNSYQVLNLLPLINNININELNCILQKQVTPSAILCQLQEKNADNWVRQGFYLHKHTQEKKCLFCGAILLDDKLKQLDKMFESEYDTLGSSLLEVKSLYNKIEITTPIAASFAECYREDYIQEEKKLIIFLNDYNNRLFAVQKIINAKLLKRNLQMSTYINLNPYRNELMDCIMRINALITKHNEFIKQEKQEKQKITKQIENHFVAELLLSPNYRDAIEKEQETKEAHGKCRNKLKQILIDIEKLNAQISDTHKGAELINYYLSVLFLGEPTIKLHVDKHTDENGKDTFATKLYRGEDLADNLSEGEKTSIAFAHFLAKIDKSVIEGTSDKEIIFIDDPISSLDYNHIYSVSIIISKLRDKFNQVFVSTHNFELYRLLSQPCNTKDKKENGVVNFARDRLYFIKRLEDKSIISKIPKALIEFKTEYNFLFYNLKEFLINPTEDNIFLIAHCARRFLEIYLLGRYPNTKKLDQKLKDFASDNKIDDTELIILYKIVNDESHTHSEKSFDKSFMINAINKIVELLIRYDNHHYECLEKSTIENKSVTITN